MEVDGCDAGSLDEQDDKLFFTEGPERDDETLRAIR